MEAPPSPGPLPGAVSLTSAITVGGLIFNTSGYNISSSANALTFGGTNNTVVLNNSVTAATITGTLGTSSANMIFTAQNPLANHTLTFTGANRRRSGTTTINAGLTLTTTSTSGNINQTLNSTSGITLNGGAIQFNRATNAQLNAISDTAPIAVYGGGTFGVTSADAGGVNALETIGAVTVHSGQMNFNWTNGASSGAQMILSDLTRAGSTSAVTFSGNSGSTGRWKVTGAGTTTAGEILGPWATTGAANGINAQNDYAVYNGDFVAAANIAASAQSTWSTTHAATSNYTLNNSAVASPANGRLTADRNINTLRNTTLAQNLVASDAATDVITIAGGHNLVNGDVVAIRTITGMANGQAYYVINATGTTLQLSATSGGAAANVTTSGAAGFMTAGLNLNGQTLGTYGILNGSSEPLAIGGGSGSSITLPTAVSGNLYVTNGNASVWIDAPITNNGAGVLTLVKGGTSGNGSGNVTLSGNNTYTGGTVVNSGNITLSGTNTFATGSAGADVINGGSLTYSTIASWGGTGRDVTFNGTGTLTSTVVGYSGGTLTSNADANATIVSTNNGAAGSTQISFATTTGAGNVIYNTGNNRLLNLGDASGLTGNLQARLNNNANHSTATAVQFSAIGDAAGSAIQFVGGTSNGEQAMTIAYNGSSALVFNNRQIQILDRVASNWELRENIIANNSTDAAHTWTINTDLLYTGGRAITAFRWQSATNRRFVLSGSNSGDNAFNGVISDGQNTNGLHLEKAGSGKWIVSNDNTFTGDVIVSAGTLVISGTGKNAATVLTGGVLEAAVLADGGSVSNIGDSWSNPNSLRFSGGTLRYNGDGDSTNRNFAMLGSGTIDSSGTDALVFSQTGVVSPDASSTANFATAQKVVTGLSSTADLAVGMRVTGTGIAANSTVASIDSATQITLNNNTTAVGSATSLSFGYPTARTLTLTGSNAGANTIAGILQNSTATGSGVLSLAKSGVGTWVLSGANSYTGTTSINDGALEAADGTGLTTTSILQLRGGVFQSSGTFSRAVSTAAGAVNWSTSSGGFAARGGTLNLQLDGGTGSLTWNGTSMVSTGQSLIFGSTSADSLVDFQNDLNLGSSLSGQRTITVNDNTGSTTDIARISGQITNTAAGWGILKNGAGALELTNTNTYTGATTVNAGTLEIASSGSTHASSAVTVSNTGTALVVNGTVNGTLVANVSTDRQRHWHGRGAATVSGDLNPGNSPGVLSFDS